MVGLRTVAEVVVFGDMVVEPGFEVVPLAESGASKEATKGIY